MWWLLHLAGLDDASGPWYLFWSGVGSDLGELAIVGGRARRHPAKEDSPMTDALSAGSDGGDPTPVVSPALGVELPGLDPTTDDLAPQVTELDWPPAQQGTPDDPADTPGWYDDQNAAINGGGDDDDPEH